MQCSAHSAVPHSTTHTVRCGTARTEEHGAHRAAQHSSTHTVQHGTAHTVRCSTAHADSVVGSTVQSSTACIVPCGTEHYSAAHTHMGAPPPPYKSDLPLPTQGTALQPARTGCAHAWPADMQSRRESHRASLRRPVSLKIGPQIKSNQNQIPDPPPPQAPPRTPPPPWGPSANG